MAEFTANAVQAVEAGQNVLFTDAPISGQNEGIIHRDGSGIITLRSQVNSCSCNYNNFAKFTIGYGGNIAIPEGGTASTPLSFAITIDGQPIQTSTTIITPAEVNAYWHIESTTQIELPIGCCYVLALQNIGTITTNIQNTHFSVKRNKEVNL